MEQLLEMLQLALFNRVPCGKFNRASASPVVRFSGLRRASIGTWDVYQSGLAVS